MLSKTAAATKSNPKPVPPRRRCSRWQQQTSMRVDLGVRRVLPGSLFLAKGQRMYRRKHSLNTPSCAASSHDGCRSENCNVDCRRQQTPFVLFAVAARILSAGERRPAALSCDLYLIVIVNAVCHTAGIRRTSLVEPSRRDPNSSALCSTNSAPSLQFWANASRRWLSRQKRSRSRCKKTDRLHWPERTATSDTLDAARERELQQRLRLVVAEGRPFCSACHVRGS